MPHLFFLIEAPCFLTGFFLWRKEWAPQYKVLVLLMGLTVLVEAAAYFLGQRYHQNVWLLNLFAPLESGTYIYVFYRESVHPVFRCLYRCLLAAIFLAVLITYLLQPHFFAFNVYGYIAGLFLLLLGAAAFFIEYMLSRMEGHLTQLPVFWLAAGVILFCCVHILLFSLLTYLAAARFTGVNLFANLFLYAGVTGCFVCTRRSQK